MDTYNWGDLTEEEKLNVLHIWCERIDTRLRQLGEKIDDIRTRLNSTEAKRV